MAVDFEDEFMGDAEFAALDAAMRAAEARQGAAATTDTPSATDLPQSHGDAVPEPLTGSAAVQPALPQAGRPPEQQTNAAATHQPVSAQPQQLGATPARWGGARPSGAALRGIAVPSALLRSGQSEDRRLSGASVGSQCTADGQAAQTIASPEQLAAEMAAEQALAKAQRDDVPHLALQLTPSEADGDVSRQEEPCPSQQSRPQEARQASSAQGHDGQQSAQPGGHPDLQPATAAAACAGAVQAIAEHGGGSSEVHRGVECDVCGMYPVKGLCYTSSVLRDYDLCSRCWQLPAAERGAPYTLRRQAASATLGVAPPATTASGVPGTAGVTGRQSGAAPTTPLTAPAEAAAAEAATSPSTPAAGQAETPLRMRTRSQSKSARPPAWEGRAMAPKPQPMPAERPPQGSARQKRLKQQPAEAAVPDAAAAAEVLQGQGQCAADLTGDQSPAKRAGAAGHAAAQQPEAWQASAQPAAAEASAPSAQPSASAAVGKLEQGSPTIALFKGSGGQMLLMPKSAAEPSATEPPGNKQRGGRGNRKQKGKGQAAQPSGQQQQPPPPPPPQQGQSASAGQPQLLDIEEYGLRKNRLRAFRRRGLVVTDFTASEWCQQQVAFTLSAKIPREDLETEAMRAGTRIHAELEAQTTTAVEVHVETWEDFWAVRLLNSVAGLRQLATEGLTREVYVFGLVQGQWVRGIIDQLQLDAEGRLQVVEHKTRARPTLPRPAQVRATQLQVALYRNLLDGLSRLSDEQLEDFLDDALRIDSRRTLSPEVEAHAVAIAGQGTATAHEAACLLRAAAMGLPQGALGQQDAALFVRYWWQGDGEMFAEVPVESSVLWVPEALERHLVFWGGQAPPAAVVKEDAWKCGFCIFWRQCQAGLFYTRQGLCH